VKEPSNWRRPDMLYTSDKGPFIFIASQYAEGTAFYNKAVVKNFDMRNEDDLLSPRLRGLIATEDATRPNAGTYVLSSLTAAKGEDYMRRLLGEMKPVFIANQKQLADHMMRGDSAVMIGGSPEYIARCWKAGGCKEIIRLPIKPYLLGRGVAVMRNAPNKDATKIWINWLLSREGQQIYVQEWAKTNETGAVSMRTDVEPHPEHLPSVPDYPNMHTMFRPSTDAGTSYMQAVSRIYKETRD
jgi:ABC-type Fe3+ transport system substrate-binding protein